MRLFKLLGWHSEQRRREAPRRRPRVEALEERLVLDANDQIGEAIALGAMTQTRTWAGESVDPVTDVEMYSFSVAAGQRVGFDIDRPSGNLDSWLRLFDQNGQQLDYNDDGAAPGESYSWESYIDFTFTNPGTYFLGVSGYGNPNYHPVSGEFDTGGATGPYTLIVTPLSGGGPAGDPDDQIVEATSLGSMTQTRSASGQVDPDTDVDVYSFTVAAGQRIAIDLDQTSSPALDSWLRLFRANGQQLTQNDDGPTPGEPPSYESYIEFTFDVAGTYYVGVSGYGNSHYDPINGGGDNGGVMGGYALTLTASQGGNEDTNDQISEAVWLQAMTEDRIWQRGTIDSPTDVDVFSFVVSAGQRVAFDVDRLSGNVDSYVRLFRSNGEVLDFDDNGDERDDPGERGSTESYFEYVFRNEGTYYLGVSARGNDLYNPTTGDGDLNGTGTGEYRLTLRGMVDVRTAPRFADYSGHLGNDHTTDVNNPQQDVGRILTAPVSGQVVAVRSGYGAYGELLVAIRVPVTRGRMMVREDGTPRPVDSSYATVFLGHLTTRRYDATNQLVPDSPTIALREGDRVVAGVTHVGYIAPTQRNGGSEPHVHVGMLPYAENARGTAPYVTLPDRNGRRTSTHFPGFWNTGDTRPMQVDGRPSTYFHWVRSRLIAPPTTWDGWSNW